MKDESGYLMLVFIGIFFTFIFTSANWNVTIYPKVIEQAKTICSNYDGLDAFAQDSGKELVVFCKSGDTFTTKVAN